MDTLQNVLKILQAIITIASIIFGLKKPKGSKKTVLVWMALIAAILGAVVIFQDGLKASELEHPWYLRIKQSTIKRTNGNPVGQRLAYRVTAFVNGQEYSFPYGALLIQENITATLPDKFALPGSPPYHIKFEAKLVDINDDALKPPRILEGPEDVIEKAILPLSSLTNETADTTITGYDGRTKLTIEYSIGK